ncbi:MAG: helix-turn-helix transcriptional regulator [Verrucomicrobiota bacterium]
MKFSPSPRTSSVKSERHSRRKLRGAAIFSDHAWHEIGRTLNITKRGLQIVQAVFDNQHESQIGKIFKISPHTVHMHMNRLFKKLNVTSRTELVLRIVEQMITLTLAETRVLPPLCPRHHTGKCCLHSSPAPLSKPAKP